MHQVPQEIWQEIHALANEQIRTQWADRLFPESAETVTEELEQQGMRMRGRGVDNKVVLAFQMTAPLLQEREAISTYLAKTHRVDLRGALPELETVDDAVLLAEKELMLSPRQSTTLRNLLTEAGRSVVLREGAASSEPPNP